MNTRGPRNRPPSARLAVVIGSLASPLALGDGAAGQAGTPEQIEVVIQFDSGFVENATADRGVVFSHELLVRDASWLRLSFDQATLGNAPAGGAPTVLRITSLFDGGVQTLESEHLVQWQYTSAFFNGERLRVELVADPGADPSRVAATRAFAGPAGTLRSICGSTDDRVLSSDARVGRTFPRACTTFIIDDLKHCLLTAGHCATEGHDIVEFNVPLSDPDGSINHPLPEDQYAIDPDSVQFVDGGLGNDWTYYGCFRNTQTDLTPFERQGQFFHLVAPPAVNGQMIRVTGFGKTDPPVPDTWNQAQKTHVGPYDSLAGTAVGYVVDTTSKNSGSPVVDETTGDVIAIHTHGNCDGGGTSNFGTATTNVGLQAALANPQGVCEPHGCVVDFNGDFQVDVTDLLQTLAAWGLCPPGAPCPTDVDGNGATDVGDLLDVLAQWGSCWI